MASCATPPYVQEPGNGFQHKPSIRQDVGVGRVKITLAVSVVNLIRAHNPYYGPCPFDARIGMLQRFNFVNFSRG
jgi:hypothetical protein